MTAPPDFMECAACAAKPGSPPLCASCLHNRARLEELRKQLVLVATAQTTRSEDQLNESIEIGKRFRDRLAAAEKAIAKARKDLRGHLPKSAYRALDWRNR